MSILIMNPRQVSCVSLQNGKRSSMFVSVGTIEWKPRRPFNSARCETVRWTPDKLERPGLFSQKQPGQSRNIPSGKNLLCTRLLRNWPEIREVLPGWNQDRGSI